MAHRIQITLEDDQYARLRVESRRTGLGPAELVRRAVNHTYGTTGSENRLRALNAGFGAWAERDIDGEDYVENPRPGLARRLTERRRSSSTPPSPAHHEASRR